MRKQESFQLEQVLPLDPDQEEARDFILDKYYDPSGSYSVQMLPGDTGWGKTRVAVLIAQTLALSGLLPFVVCPLTLIPQWKEIFASAGIPCAGFYTYAAIRGSGVKCNHPWLVRESGKTGPFHATDYLVEMLTPSSEDDVIKVGTAYEQYVEVVESDNPDIASYEVTKFRPVEFEKVKRQGLFFIFDEIHHIKNPSGQHYACYEMIRTALYGEKRVSETESIPCCARVLHLSASPVDKAACYEPFFRTMGFISDRKKICQFNPGRREMLWREFGLGDAVKVASMFDQRKAMNIVHSFDKISKKSAMIILARLWDEILKEHYCVKVVDIDTGFRRDRFNGFFTLDEEGRELANDAIAALRSARVIREDGRIDANQLDRSFAQIQAALVQLNRAKMATVARLALDDLRNNPDCKVIVACSFLDDQAELARKLIFYNPLVLNGQVPKGERTQIVADFNKPTDEHRVFIMTPGVGGEGINLDDKDGRFPRKMYIVPTYHFHAMFQSSGRTYRRGMKSDAWVCFVYANNAPIESVLINTMRKTEVAKSILKEGSGRVFPGAYEFFIEDEDPSNEEHRMLRADLIRTQREERDSLYEE